MDESNDNHNLETGRSEQTIRSTPNVMSLLAEGIHPSTRSLYAANTGRADREPFVAKVSDGCLGFSTLPEQIYRQMFPKGIHFNLMVIGESGLGKSTFVNSMFMTDIYSDEYPGLLKRAAKTVAVETTKVLLKEKSVDLHLTIVDTPGFGCAVDNTNCWQPITDFIENRYEEYLNAETRVHWPGSGDNRIHCCLYFIQPSGHSLKPLDIEFMLHLHDKVNIIPVVAKADTLTPEECLQFKKNVMNEISKHKIKVYEFGDEEELKNRIPFAVVGGNHIIQTNGERKRGRKYAWGCVDIENTDHSDVALLRTLLLGTFMWELMVTTNAKYENYSTLYKHN